MVTFTDSGYTIHVKTVCEPIENWMLLHSVLLDLIHNVPTDNLPPDMWIVADFLAEMMPPLDIAQKML